jgi:hypothetical protein
MADERYVVMTVECSRCKTKQRVYVNTRTGLPPKIGDQMVLCIRCGDHFKVTLPDRIIRGPFPAYLPNAAVIAPWVIKCADGRYNG